LGVVAFEGVASCPVEERGELGAEVAAFLWAEQAGQDDVAVAVQGGQVGFELCAVDAAVGIIAAGRAVGTGGLPRR
jgi:hypothetical protein